MSSTQPDHVDTPTGSPAAARTPAAALEQLAVLLGRWQGHGTFFPVFGVPLKPIDMVVEVSRELGGRWYILRTAEQATVANPDPLSATYVWGYDEAAQQFVAAWFDSTGGRATQTSPGWRGDTLIFTGEMTAGGRTFPLRDTFVLRGPRAYGHRGEAHLDGRWITVDEEEFGK